MGITYKMMADILTQGKVCSHCGKWKLYEEYYNMKASPDGKQYRCKVCCSKEGKRFRKERPKYYNKYYYNNQEKIYNINQKWRVGEDNTTCYAIHTEVGSYIGVTTQALNARLHDHKKDYRLYKEGKTFRRLPKLHKYFDTLTQKEIYNIVHSAEALEIIEGRDIQEANDLETKWIRLFEVKGRKLLNTNKVSK